MPSQQRLDGPGAQPPDPAARQRGDASGAAAGREGPGKRRETGMDTGICTIYIMKFHEIYEGLYWIHSSCKFSLTLNFHIFTGITWFLTTSGVSGLKHLVVEIVACLGQEDDRESGSEASEETDDENDVTVPQM